MTHARLTMSSPARIAVGAFVGVSAGLIVALAGPLPLLLLIGGVLLLAGTMVAPGIVFAGYLLIAFYKGAIQDYDSPLDITLFLALANAFQVVPVYLERKRRDASVLGIALWLAMGLLVVAGVLYAPDQSSAFGKAVTYWALVVLPIFPAAMRVGSEPRYVSQFLWTFFAVGLLTVVRGIAQLSVSDRLDLKGMNTIQVGRAALLVPLVGIAWVLPQRRLVPSLVTVIAIPFALIVAIASGSRGPVVVLVLIGIAVGIRYLTRPYVDRRRALGAAAGLVFVSLVVISIAGPRLPALSVDRFASLVTYIQGEASGDPGSAGGETSAAARVRLYQYAAQLSAERPVFGAGTGAFATLSPRALGLGADAYPHNAILQITAEHGLLGLAVFLGMFAIALVRRLPGRYTGPTLHILLLYFLLNAMVSGDILTDRETLGLLLLTLMISAPVAVAAESARRSDSPDVEPEPASARHLRGDIPSGQQAWI